MGEEKPPPCRCGHIAYEHTELVVWQMLGIPCRSANCACPAYQPLCPGSGLVVSHQLTGPGRHECPHCKEFVPMRDGRLKPHEQDR